MYTAHAAPHLPVAPAAGQCLSRDNLAQLIQFAHEEGIVLMADEVYQENIYQDERPFISARKVGRVGAPGWCTCLQGWGKGV
jgi:bifunctional pyridoxal-dependent enzyme with beta-cystathionase and maltose regulon repressor activities